MQSAKLIRYPKAAPRVLPLQILTADDPAGAALDTALVGNNNFAFFLFINLGRTGIEALFFDAHRANARVFDLEMRDIVDHIAVKKQFVFEFHFYWFPFKSISTVRYFRTFHKRHTHNVLP